MICWEINNDQQIWLITPFKRIELDFLSQEQWTNVSTWHENIKLLKSDSLVKLKHIPRCKIKIKLKVKKYHSN